MNIVLVLIHKLKALSVLHDANSVTNRSHSHCHWQLRVKPSPSLLVFRALWLWLVNISNTDVCTFSKELVPVA